MQDECRHQTCNNNRTRPQESQTDQSRLRQHRQQCPLSCAAAAAAAARNRPSQTEMSYLREHHKPMSKRSSDARSEGNRSSQDSQTESSYVNDHYIHEREKLMKDMPSQTHMQPMNKFTYPTQFMRCDGRCADLCGLATSETDETIYPTESNPTTSRGACPATTGDVPTSSSRACSCSSKATKGGEGDLPTSTPSPASSRGACSCNSKTTIGNPTSPTSSRNACPCSSKASKGDLPTSDDYHTADSPSSSRGACSCGGGTSKTNYSPCQSTTKDIVRSNRPSSCGCSLRRCLSRADNRPPFASDPQPLTCESLLCGGQHQSNLPAWAPNPNVQRTVMSNADTCGVQWTANEEETDPAGSCRCPTQNSSKVTTLATQGKHYSTPASTCPITSTIDMSLSSKGMQSVSNCADKEDPCSSSCPVTSVDLCASTALAGAASSKGLRSNAICGTKTSVSSCPATSLSNAVADPCPAKAVADPCSSKISADPCSSRALMADPCSSKIKSVPCIIRDMMVERRLSKATVDPCSSKATVDPCSSKASADPCSSRTVMADPCSSKVMADPCSSRAMMVQPCLSKAMADPCSSRAMMAEPCLSKPVMVEPCLSKAMADPCSSRAMMAEPCLSKPAMVEPCFSKAMPDPCLSKVSVDPCPSKASADPCSSKASAGPCSSRSIMAGSCPWKASAGSRLSRPVMADLSSTKTHINPCESQAVSNPCSSRGLIETSAIHASCGIQTSLLGVNSAGNLEPIFSDVSTHQHQLPSSFGIDEQTSGTSRSRSIVNKITCLCSPDQKSFNNANLDKAPHEEGHVQYGNEEMPENSEQCNVCEICPPPHDPMQSLRSSVRDAPIPKPLQIKCLKSSCTCKSQCKSNTKRKSQPSPQSQTTQRPRRVQREDQDDFQDCVSFSSTVKTKSSRRLSYKSSPMFSCQQEESLPIITSLYNQDQGENASGQCPCGICGLSDKTGHGGDESQCKHSKIVTSGMNIEICGMYKDEPPTKSCCDKSADNTSMDMKSCREPSTDKASESGYYCSPDTSAYTDYTDAPCKELIVESRKERILDMVQQLSEAADCDCNEDRPAMIQNLFRELALLLRMEEERAVAPQDEVQPPKPTFEECCTAQQKCDSQQPNENGKDSTDRRRIYCFEQLDDAVRQCILQEEPKQLPELEIYELETDTDSDAEDACAKSLPPAESTIFKDADGQGCGNGDDFMDMTSECNLMEQMKKILEEPGPEECDLCEDILQQVIEPCHSQDNDKFSDPSPPKQPSPKPAPCPTIAPCPSTEPLKTETCVNVESYKQTDSKQQLCASDFGHLLPDGQLSPQARQLCEKLLRQALVDCGACDAAKGPTLGPSQSGPCSEAASKPKVDPKEGGKCQCCHCRALRCDNECQTVSKTLRSAIADPACEMKCFIDSMIMDLEVMDHVLCNNKAKARDVTANCSGNAPGDSFPVTITAVSSLGCTALYIRWELQDCAGIGGYEIYLDGNLRNRFYSYRHQAAVVANVDVTKGHQIVLRAQALGYDFPGEDVGVGNCKTVARTSHPEMLAGAKRPWSPSVYFYDPSVGVRPTSSAKRASQT
ncbi:GL12129 [Drosophila persimilis]|uniref:GL12129 n=1 Tax=Drosophila persimilis TaxID=7234 RepID=B4GL11_DROPE|nr:GL12129 [Drosophila persimilis]